MMLPTDRNIAIKISNNYEYNYIKKISEYETIYKYFEDFRHENIWIYLETDTRVMLWDDQYINPVEAYPRRKFLIINIKNLIRQEKLKRINE